MGTAKDVTQGQIGKKGESGAGFISQCPWCLGGRESTG